MLTKATIVSFIEKFGSKCQLICEAGNGGWRDVFIGSISFEDLYDDGIAFILYPLDEKELDELDTSLITTEFKTPILMAISAVNNINALYWKPTQE